MSWICDGCRRANFTPKPPCSSCGASVAATAPPWWPREVQASVTEAEREAVRVAQRALRVEPTGEMDAATRSALRGAQYLFGLERTGVLDEPTAIVVDGLRPYQLQEDS